MGCSFNSVALYYCSFWCCFLLVCLRLFIALIALYFLVNLVFLVVDWCLVVLILVSCTCCLIV